MTIDYITIYSQTETPDENPEDGVVIAFGTFSEDRMTRCWVVTRDENDIRPGDEVTTDSLGVKQIICKNLTSFNVRHDDSKTLREMCEILLANGDYTEIDPMYFRLISED